MRVRSNLAAGACAVRAPYRRRALAALLALTVALTFATSSLTLSHELHHDCTGDGCAVCAEMAMGLHLVRAGFSAPGAPAALGAVLPVLALLSLGVVLRRAGATTLVSLHVQLND